MRAELEQLLGNPNVQTYLNGLKQAEGTAKHADPYRVAGGGKVTLTQLDRYEPNMWGFTETTGKKNQSSAAGAYQIIQDTYKEFAPKLGITDFSAKSQDLIALGIMQSTGSLKDVLNGDFQAAVGVTPRSAVPTSQTQYGPDAEVLGAST
jgi:muramidase (phage lysozyme)